MAQVPILFVQLAGRGFSFGEAEAFVEDLEASLHATNPGALMEVKNHVGEDLTTFKAGLRAQLTEARMSAHQHVWQPNGAPHPATNAIKAWQWRTPL